MEQTIELRNVGPIERLSIPIPESGGLCVLRARNGRGKTKALDAIESAIGGSGRIDVRDGQRRGQIDAFGVTLTVGRSTRRKGELEVSSLTGRFNIEHLVDPKIKSPDAADAVRIKALIQIAGIKPDPTAFYEILGGRDRFEALVDSSTLDAADPVTMADRIKRSLEAEARKRESQAEHAEGRARGAANAAAGIDVEQPSDACELQTQLEQAITHHAGLAAKAKAQADWRRRVQAARDALEDAEAGYTGPTLEEAARGVQTATAEVERATRAVAAAEKALEAARATAKEADRALRHALAIRDTTDQHERTVAAWRETVSGPEVPPVPEAALRSAADQVEFCRRAVETGVLVRKALQTLAEGDEALCEANEHRKAADSLRESAKATDEVLSGLVAQAGVPLRVEAGRLVLDTSRGATFFADLSQGERRKLAIDAGIRHVGERGVIPICQEAYESLDPIARRELAEHLRQRGVVGITAECSEDEDIRAEIV